MKRPNLGGKVWQRRKSFHASARRKATDVAHYCESSQFRALTFFRGPVSSPETPSGTAEPRKRFSEILNERFRIINIRLDACAFRGCSWFDLVEPKFMCDLFNDCG